MELSQRTCRVRRHFISSLSTPDLAGPSAPTVAALAPCSSALSTYSRLSNCCCQTSSASFVQPTAPSHTRNCTALCIARSPPPVASPSTAKPPSLSTLPPEIVHRIIQLALPPVAFATFPERYETLLRFSLVDAFWRELAQRELQRHAGFTTTEQAEKFLQQNSNLNGGTRTRSVWRDFTAPSSTAAETEQVGHLLGLPSLKSVAYADECTGVMALDLTTLAASADTLQTLALNYVQPPFPSDTSLPRFSNLRRLVLSDLFYDSSAVANLLSAISTPQLDTLLLLTYLDDADVQPSALNAELERLGPHLKVLGLDPSLPIQDATWQALHSVETLVFIKAAAFAAISSCPPPSTLRQIVFVPEAGGRLSTSILLPYVRSSKAFLKPVQVLRVPLIEHERQEREQLFSLCKELEVEIHESRYAHYDSWAEYMDDLLSLW